MEIIRIEWLEKTFRTRRKRTHVLQWVNLSVQQWEIYGFLGANGVGKTTLLKCIFHYIDHDTGSIALFGTTDYYHQRYFTRIGYAPEVTNLYPFLTGRELLSYMNAIYPQSSTLHSSWNTADSHVTSKIAMLLEKLWLSFAADRLVGSYSKGMKQRLSLAASLINDPELIFWDEPMSWLDPLGRILVKDLMKELKKQGKTIFFNTHILSDVQEIADRFGILHKGEIVHEDAPSAISGSLEEFFTKTVRELDTHVTIF